MAVETNAAQAIEKSPMQIAGEAGTSAPNPELVSRSETEEDARWKLALGLTCELVVDLPLPGFRIGDLLKLRTGSVIDALWRAGQDVPLRLNGAQIGWIEFEVVGDRLAVRLTELA